MLSRGRKNYFSSHNDYEEQIINMGYIAPQKVASALCAHFNQSQHIKVLDVGCGTGLLAEAVEMLFPKAEIYGVDSARPMIQEALNKQRLKEAQIVDLARKTIPYPDNYFHAVLSSGAAEFIGHKHHLVKEMARVAMPGGVVTSTFLLRDRRYYASAFLCAAWNLSGGIILNPMNPHPLRYAEGKKNVEQVFTKNNLKIENTQTFIGYNAPSKPKYYMVTAEKAL
jgi:ubiquinone/menaquinone biosynthesis C-methylase UbiE